MDTGIGPLDRKPLGQDRAISTQTRGTDIPACHSAQHHFPQEVFPTSQAQLGVSAGLPLPLWFPNTILIWPVNFHSFIQQISVEDSTFQVKC